MRQLRPGCGEAEARLAWPFPGCLGPCFVVFKSWISFTGMPVPAPFGCSLPPGGGNEPCRAPAGVGTSPVSTTRQCALMIRNKVYQSDPAQERSEVLGSSPRSATDWMSKSLLLFKPQLTYLRHSRVYHAISLEGGAALSGLLKASQMQ